MATLKDRGILKFPARVLAATGIGVKKLAGVYTFALDLISFTLATAVSDLTATQVLIFTDNGDGTGAYSRLSLSSLVAASQGAVQVITAAGPANINANANLVIVNQTVGAAITLNLPASASKIGKVKIVDWKGDAGTNTITVVPNGSETFNGALTSFPINGNGASAVFDPYPGAGYAI
jgi:hypothetical protein